MWFRGCWASAWVTEADAVPSTSIEVAADLGSPLIHFPCLLSVVFGQRAPSSMVVCKCHTNSVSLVYLVLLHPSIAPSSTSPCTRGLEDRGCCPSALHLWPPVSCLPQRLALEGSPHASSFPHFDLAGNSARNRGWTLATGTASVMVRGRCCVFYCRVLGSTGACHVRCLCSLSPS